MLYIYIIYNITKLQVSAEIAVNTSWSAFNACTSGACYLRVVAYDVAFWPRNVSDCFAAWRNAWLKVGASVAKYLNVNREWNSPSVLGGKSKSHRDTAWIRRYCVNVHTYRHNIQGKRLTINKFICNCVATRSDLGIITDEPRHDSNASRPGDVGARYVFRSRIAVY